MKVRYQSQESPHLSIFALRHLSISPPSYPSGNTNSGTFVRMAIRRVILLWKS